MSELRARLDEIKQRVTGDDTWPWKIGTGDDAAKYQPIAFVGQDENNVDVWIYQDHTQMTGAGVRDIAESIVSMPDLIEIADEAERLLAESRAREQGLREVIAAYKEYVDLLERSESNLAGIAAVHGVFVSDEDAAKGHELRSRIAVALATDDTPTEDKG